MPAARMEEHPLTARGLAGPTQAVLLRARILPRDALSCFIFCKDSVCCRVRALASIPGWRADSASSRPAPTLLGNPAPLPARQKCATT